MGEAIAFYAISAFILGFAVLVVTTRDTVHSVLFLVLDFLFVAALYVLLSAPFLAVIQILVYAGGIVVLYLFVVMLVNLKRPPEAHQDPHRRFGGRDRDDEDREYLANGVMPLARKRHQVDVDGIQNQLNRHENDDDVAPHHHTGHADDEESGGQEHVMRRSDHESHIW